MIGINSTYASSGFHQWQLWDKYISHCVWYLSSESLLGFLFYKRWARQLHVTRELTCIDNYIIYHFETHPGKVCRENQISLRQKQQDKYF
jgi:hypothetical protein